MTDLSGTPTFGDQPARRRPRIIDALARTAIRVPAQLILGIIWLYRHTLSPVLPVAFGPSCGCRFHPSCAVYAAEAVQVHGALVGGWLAVRRLLKCQPLHPGGIDPVPARPIARRVPRATTHAFDAQPAGPRA